MPTSRRAHRAAEHDRRRAARRCGTASRTSASTGSRSGTTSTPPTSPATTASRRSPAHAALACRHEPGAVRLARVLRRLPPPRGAGQRHRHHRPPERRPRRHRARRRLGVQRVRGLRHPVPVDRASGSTSSRRRCSASARLLREEVTTTSTASTSQLTDARCEPKPVQAELPIWVGGGGEKRTLRDRGRSWADGWNVPVHRPPRSSPASATCSPSHCAAVGRDLERDPVRGERRPRRRRRSLAPAVRAAWPTIVRPGGAHGLATTRWSTRSGGTSRPAPTRSTSPCGRRGTSGQPRARWPPPCSAVRDARPTDVRAARRLPVRRRHRGLPDRGRVQRPGEPRNNWYAWERDGRVEPSGIALDFWNHYEDHLDRAVAAGCDALPPVGRVGPLRAGRRRVSTTTAFDRYRAILDAVPRARPRTARHAAPLHPPGWLGEDFWLPLDAPGAVRRVGARRPSTGSATCVAELGDDQRDQHPRAADATSPARSRPGGCLSIGDRGPQPRPPARRPRARPTTRSTRRQPDAVVATNNFTLLDLRARPAAERRAAGPAPRRRPRRLRAVAGRAAAPSTTPPSARSPGASGPCDAGRRRPCRSSRRCPGRWPRSTPARTSCTLDVTQLDYYDPVVGHHIRLPGHRTAGGGTGCRADCSGTTRPTRPAFAAYRRRRTWHRAGRCGSSRTGCATGSATAGPTRARRLGPAPVPARRTSARWSTCRRGVPDRRLLPLVARRQLRVGQLRAPVRPVRRRPRAGRPLARHRRAWATTRPAPTAGIIEGLRAGDRSVVVGVTATSTDDRGAIAPDCTGTRAADASARSVGGRARRGPNLPTAGCPFCVGGHRGAGALRRAGRSRTGGRRSPTTGARSCCTPPTTTRRSASLGVDGARQVVDLWAERTAALGARDDVAYVLVFENRGAEVGATIAHPHGQIFAYDRRAAVPARELARLAAGLRAAARTTPATGSWPSAAAGGRGCRAAAPTRTACVVAPRRAPSRPAVARRRRRATGSAAVLVDVLGRLDRLFDAPMPYMLWFHQRPTDGGDWPAGPPARRDRRPAARAPGVHALRRRRRAGQRRCSSTRSSPRTRPPRCGRADASDR